VNIEGQIFDWNGSICPQYWDFGPDDVLVVDHMIEPIIMGTNGLRKQGTVMLKKVQQ
jgi:hypothetical protein